MHDYPRNLFFLFLYTTTLSIWLAVICATLYDLGGGKNLLISIGFTFTIFSVITLFTFQTRVEFTWTGAILFAIVFGFIEWILIVLYLPSTLWRLMAYFGATLYSFYIIFDTSMFLNDGDPEDVIGAVISLYLDIYNIFFCLMSTLKNNINS